jgi:hypothetical protein
MIEGCDRCWIQWSLHYENKILRTLRPLMYLGHAWAPHCSSTPRIDRGQLIGESGRFGPWNGPETRNRPLSLPRRQLLRHRDAKLYGLAIARAGALLKARSLNMAFPYTFRQCCLFLVLYPMEIGHE